jgi:hypothetical protein
MKAEFKRLNCIELTAENSAEQVLMAEFARSSLPTLSDDHVELVVNNPNVGQVLQNLAVGSPMEIMIHREPKKAQNLVIPAVKIGRGL